MLKWLTGGRSAPPAAGPLLTDDPLATIADRASRQPCPVYGVTRVNPLFREGASVSSATGGAASVSSDAESVASERDTDRHSLLDHVHTRRQPISLTDKTTGATAGPASGGTPSQLLSEHCLTAGATETEESRSLQRLTDHPNVPKGYTSQPQLHPAVQGVVSSAKKQTVRALRPAHNWVGFDVLAIDQTYVSSMSVNLAKNAPESWLGSFENCMPYEARSVAGNGSVTHLSKNPKYVREVKLTAPRCTPTVCPRLLVSKHSQFVISISAQCTHINQLPNVSSSDYLPLFQTTCSSVNVDINANYVVNISTACSHFKLPPSDTAPHMPHQSQYNVTSAPSNTIITPVSIPRQEVASNDSHSAPDSLVSDSLLVLTSSSLSPDATLSLPPPSAPCEDGRAPEQVLRELSNIITNSRSVAAVRRAGSEARSSSTASSVTSHLSRASSSASGLRRQMTAPDAATLWQRSGLLTNGRKLVGGEEEGFAEEPAEVAMVSPAVGRRLTPSPPVPARLPVAGDWLQRLTAVPVRSSAPDPVRLTEVVVEPRGSVSRHVSFTISRPQMDGVTPLTHSAQGSSVTSLASASKDVTSQWLTAPGRDRQGLWNSYYGGALSGYGPLQPSAAALKHNQKAAALNDRKFSAFTLDVTSASRLLQRAVENKRSRRLCRIAIIALVLAALLGSIVLVSWICSQGRHLFGTL